MSCKKLSLDTMYTGELSQLEHDNLVLFAPAMTIDEKWQAGLIDDDEHFYLSNKRHKTAQTCPCLLDSLCECELSEGGHVGSGFNLDCPKHGII